jgi:hypothetical protein
MIPVVIKPKVLAAKNRCRQSFRRKSLLLRDIFLILFAFVVVAVIYEGTLAMLAKMQVNANFAYMPPTLPLGLIFLFLLSMLFFSNCITALGAFYFCLTLISATLFFRQVAGCNSELFMDGANIWYSSGGSFCNLVPNYIFILGISKRCPLSLLYYSCGPGHCLGHDFHRSNSSKSHTRSALGCYGAFACSNLSGWKASGARRN